ncbi:MAG: hypothetical protein ACE5WD_11395 [Candidatus Aminicenantia bacterium]
MPNLIRQSKVRNLKASFDCITSGCEGTLKAQGGEMEHHVIYTCGECDLIMGVINPPAKRN